MKERMDEIPDYRKYTLQELQDVYDHLNRDRSPFRFNQVAEEIARRRDDPSLNATAEAAKAREPQAAPEELPELALRFHGRGREYFRVWIVNLCLTLLTFGLFSAWAKVRKKRYFYSHTTLDGTPFQYLARPVPILKGRVIAAAAFAVYYLSTRFFTNLLPYVLGAGAVIAPWLLVRSAAFNARYSAYRNMTFRFDGTYGGAMSALYFWGIVPAFGTGVAFNWWGRMAIAGIAVFLLGIATPWWIKGLKAFIVTHTSFGGRNGDFSATGGQFFKVYFRSGLIMVGVLVIVVGVGAFMVALLARGTKALFWVSVIPTYIGYVLAYAYIKAHSSNLVWNHTELGPLRFRSTLRGLGLAGLYVTNALGIIASLGLLIPWAVMRTMRYRVDHMQVLRAGELDLFEGSDGQSVGAVGAETVDFFDLDISL